MNTKLIIGSTVLFAIAAFIFQESRNKGLESDQKELQAELAAKGLASQSNHSNEATTSTLASPSSKDNSEQLAKAEEKLAQLAEFMSHPAPHQIYKEQQKAMVELTPLFAGLTHQDVLSIIPAGPYNFAELEDDDENIDPRLGSVFVAIQLLAQQNPPEGLLLISEIEKESSSSEEIDYFRLNAFRGWSRSAPEEAVAWYEQQRVAGATGLDDLAILAIASKAIVDPAEALTAALDNTDSKALKTSLWSLQENIKDLAGHQRLLAHLNAAHEERPNLTELTKFRTNYLNNLNRTLIDEHFKDAAKFVAENYGPEEQRDFAEHLSRMSGLPEPAKWASWLTEHGNEKFCKRFVSAAWGMRDPKGAGEWLSQQPESPLIQAIVHDYAFQLALVDKPAANEWAQTLPESKGKQKLLRQIKNR